MESSLGRVSVNRAAKLLNMSVLSVQGCLQHHALPIGGAWKNDGSNCYTYHISPAKLADYLGMTIEEVIGKEDKPNERSRNIDVLQQQY